MSKLEDLDAVRCQMIIYNNSTRKLNDEITKNNEITQKYNDNIKELEHLTKQADELKVYIDGLKEALTDLWDCLDKNEIVKYQHRIKQNEEKYDVLQKKISEQDIKSIVHVNMEKLMTSFEKEKKKLITMFNDLKFNDPNIVGTLKAVEPIDDVAVIQEICKLATEILLRKQ